MHKPFSESLPDEAKAKLEARGTTFELALYTRNFLGPKTIIFSFKSKKIRDEWLEALTESVRENMGAGAINEKAKAARELAPHARNQVVDEAQGAHIVLRALEASVSLYFRI